MHDQTTIIRTSTTDSVEAACICWRHRFKYRFSVCGHSSCRRRRPTLYLEIHCFRAVKVQMDPRNRFKMIKIQSTPTVLLTSVHFLICRRQYSRTAVPETLTILTFGRRDIYKNKKLPTRWTSLY